MTNSPLINLTRISPNRNSPRNQTIRKITFHHFAGNLTIETVSNLFQSSGRQASYNYGIGTDGRIVLIVPETDRSWASSSRDNDHQAITIGIANNTGSPEWRISDTAIQSAINLAVDVCQRNGIKSLVYDGTPNGTVTRHDMFHNTVCPGNYLASRIPDMVATINKRLGDKEVVISKDSNRNHPIVKPVQEAIIHLNRPNAQIDGGAQGIIGPTTARAIQAIQKELEITENGVISFAFLGGLLDLLRNATRGINPVTHEQVVQQLERAQSEIKTLTNNLRIESSRLNAAKAELNNAIKAKETAEKSLYKTEGELAYEKAKVSQLEIEIDKFAANLNDKQSEISKMSEKAILQSEYIKKLKELSESDLIELNEIHKEEVADLQKQLQNARRADIENVSIGELISLLFRKVADLLHR